MTRRQAVITVAGIAGYLHGQAVTSAQGQPAMFLTLDGISAVVIRYQGRQVAVNPHEILDALGAPPPQMMQQQQQRGKQ